MNTDHGFDPVVMRPIGRVEGGLREFAPRQPGAQPSWTEELMRGYYGDRSI